MPNLKLTKGAIDALEAGQKRSHYWDTDIAGFGLRLTPSGERIYILKYRFESRLRWFRIGRHGSPWTPDSARREALRLLGDVAKGIDPADERAGNRKALTFAALCDLYFAEGVAHKKPSTLRSDRARARLHLVPLLGSKRAGAITRSDIEQLLNAVIAGRTAARKPEKRRPGSIATGGRGVAAQCVALASSILQFAVQRRIRVDNPARGIKKPPVRKLQRFLSIGELRRLADSLDAELDENNPVHAVAAIRLLALTGCRHGEIAGLRWKSVDLERRLLHLSDSKTREKAVYLSPAAVEILKNLPRIEGNPFVIAGSGAKPSGAVVKTWDRVRARAGLPDVRLHDLRHTYASVGAGASVGLPIIGKLLGHSQASTTARYSHLADDPIRRAADAIGETIALAMVRRPRDVG
jgi:integrase